MSVILVHAKMEDHVMMQSTDTHADAYLGSKEKTVKQVSKAFLREKRYFDGWVFFVESRFGQWERVTVYCNHECMNMEQSCLGMRHLRVYINSMQVDLVELQ